MQLTYFDPISGRRRFKRRYAWAFWAYTAGVASGMLVLALLF